MGISDGGPSATGPINGSVRLDTRGSLDRTNIDNGLGTTTANLNFYGGGLMDTDLSAGADQLWNNFNVKIQPTLKINEAIRIRGQYRIGLLGDPTADNDYHAHFFPGVDNAFSQGNWTLLWVTAQTPVGTFAVGKRRWSWGTGLQYDGIGQCQHGILATSVPLRAAGYWNWILPVQVCRRRRSAAHDLSSAVAHFYK